MKSAIFTSDYRLHGVYSEILGLEFSLIPYFKPIEEADRNRIVILLFRVI